MARKPKTWAEVTAACDELQRREIMRALEYAGGIRPAAKALDMHLTQLVREIKRLGINNAPHK